MLTGPREHSLMKLKEQVRVLRKRLEMALKMSLLETEIQQHHIREALSQVGVVGESKVVGWPVEWMGWDD